MGRRGGVGRGVGLEVVFDLGGDQLAGAGNGQSGGLDFWFIRLFGGLGDRKVLTLQGVLGVVQGQEALL